MYPQGRRYRQGVKVNEHRVSYESGQGLVEYALIIFLVAIVVIGAVTLLGGQVGTIFNSISGSL